MADLPKEYCREMKRLLGEEYGEYLESFSMAPHAAYRINTWKVQENFLFSGERVPWCDNGYYYDAKTFFPSKHPYYYAGLYYIQEPSAMLPAAVLPVERGDMVLDLCAAPGGKATELGGRLRGTGFLVANDVSASRTMALIKNLQFAGITNTLVTAETPQRLAEIFPELFDKILIDAPCSGEGMFRRKPKMAGDWLEKGPEFYAPIQREILEHAYKMLKPGGKMVYSTCTFSVREDEETVNWFLAGHSDMRICHVQPKDGCSCGRADLVENPADSLENCIRIFPHKARGEGHFAALLEKMAGAAALPVKKTAVDSCLRKVTGDRLLQDKMQLKKKLGAAWEDMREFLSHVRLLDGALSYEKGTLFWHSYQEPEYHGLRVMSAGLPVCRWKHKVQPCPQLALALQPGDYDNVLSFAENDERVIRYLKGETLQAEEHMSGNILICVDGYGLGWCQGNAQGMLKNKYYPGWRYQS